jgi:hypothetical protein
MTTYHHYHYEDLFLRGIIEVKLANRPVTIGLTSDAPSLRSTQTPSEKRLRWALGKLSGAQRSACLAALSAGVQARVIGCDRMYIHYEALHWWHL